MIWSIFNSFLGEERPSGEADRTPLRDCIIANRCALRYNLDVTTEQPDPRNDAAELSSITTVLADLQVRVVEVADRWRAVERDDVAGDLYDVERSLRNAQRRIRRAVQGFDR